MDNKDLDKKDKLPWLLLPCMALTLSGATLLVPRHAVSAAPAALAAPALVGEAHDDGDGDELLEHWGDPRYAREEGIQMAGLAGGFLLLSGIAWRKRILKRACPGVVQAPEDEQTEQRKAA